MLIESKRHFNVLAEQFHKAIAGHSPKPIRASKIREMLAKAVGFKSHNGLLSGLPIDSQLWLEPEAVDRLRELLVSHDGIQAPVADLIELAIEQMEPVVRNVNSTSDDRTIEDYAFFRTDDFDRKLVICLSPLGRKVYDEVANLRDSIPLISVENLNRWEQDLLKVIERHPANPWPKAMYCCDIASSYWQTDWCEDLQRRPEGGYLPDADEGFSKGARSYAEELMPVAKSAIEQFQKWLGPNAKNTADPNFFSHDSETFYWPAILYMGGMIALNCGEVRLAKRWLNLNYKLTGRDSFGARYGLSVLRLNDGKGSVQSLFPKDSACSWGWLAKALDAFVRGNREKAVEHFLMALKFNYGVFEAFGHRLRGRGQIRIMANYNAPAHIQEFMFRTQPFWKTHPEAKRYFVTICHDPYVQVRLEDFYLHQSQGIGLGFKPVEYQLEHEKRSGELWEAVIIEVMAGSREAGHDNVWR